MHKKACVHVHAPFSFLPLNPPSTIQLCGYFDLRATLLPEIELSSISGNRVDSTSK